MAGVGAIRGHGGLLEGPVQIWRAPMEKSGWCLYPPQGAGPGAP